MEVVGLDHVYVTVSDFARSEAFYDRLMAYLGLRKTDRRIAGEPHAHSVNRVMQYSIRPARGGRVGHDPYRPGLHHLCFQLTDRAAVDELHATLESWGVAASAPKVWVEYNDDYYATFFADPDGLRLEAVARSKYRREIAERWDEMHSFLNPLAELHARDAARED
jgi:catechol 2,3-dioxygenase-like lactoylglutathione lyase family enzyme